MKQLVLDEIERRFDVRGERDKPFAWPDGTITADLYLPPPYHCIVQFDEPPHCTRQRAATIRAYPPHTPLNYTVRRYLADQSNGDPALAQADALTDLLPVRHGLNPTIRIRADELAELSGPLSQRIATLLDQRFAFHAGTTFQNMIETAGAKPHRLGSRDDLDRHANRDHR